MQPASYGLWQRPRVAERVPTLQQFIRYGSVGALATVVHYLLLVLAVERADWAPWWASGLGAVVGAQVAYLGNRWLTFAHAGSARVSWPRFQLTALAGAVVGMVSVAFAVWLGVPLVNIAQIFDKSGLMLTCKKSSGVATPKDFKGKTLGVWFGGNEYPFLNWMSKLGLKPDVDVKVLKQGFNVDPLLQNQAACISTMIYNEYWQVVDAGVKETDLITFFYEKEGVASLEDGLYVLEGKLKDPAFVAKMGKFLKATLKGWNDAVKNPEEAAKIVVAADPSGSATLKVQKRQMENVATLISNAGTAKVGYLDPAAYQRTVKVLLAAGSAPVIKKDPGKAAYSHAVFEAASK